MQISWNEELGLPIEQEIIVVEIQGRHGDNIRFYAFDSTGVHDQHKSSEHIRCPLNYPKIIFFIEILIFLFLVPWIDFRHQVMKEINQQILSSFFMLLDFLFEEDLENLRSTFKKIELHRLFHQRKHFSQNCMLLGFKKVNFLVVKHSCKCFNSFDFDQIKGVVLNLRNKFVSNSFWIDLKPLEILVVLEEFQSIDLKDNIFILKKQQNIFWNPILKLHNHVWVLHKDSSIFIQEKPSYLNISGIHRK